MTLATSAPMSAEQLDELLARLRLFRGDHQWVEVKRAAADLPETMASSLSALANATGGLIVLGVDETAGFRVTGLADGHAMASALRALCLEFEPVLRPRIELVDHPDGVVLVAELVAVPRNRRPCHLRSAGEFDGSWVRVDDGDHRMSAAEVTDLLALRQGSDESSRDAPEGSQLDQSLVAGFVGRFRQEVPRRAGETEAMVLESRGATRAGRVTIAGAMALGREPERTIPAARVAYRLLPRTGAPRTERGAGTHFEGTIGVLLDDVLARLLSDLPARQVNTPSGVRDVHEVDEEVLREVLANALIHRSYGEGQLDREIAVEVSDHAVRISSPGGLASGELADLGFGPFAGARNHSLVRICEIARTPSGHRICELQHSGIRYADTACHDFGMPPALFADYGSRFEALMLRGRLELAAATVRCGPYADPEDVRLIAWAGRVEALRDELDRRLYEATFLTARMAARLLAPAMPEDGAVRLARLEERGLLERRRLPSGPVWVASGNDQPVHREPRVPQREKVGRVVEAISDMGGEADAKSIGDRLGLRSTKSRSDWINAAMDAKVVEATTENPYDPSRAYRLTRSGLALAARDPGAGQGTTRA